MMKGMPRITAIVLAPLRTSRMLEMSTIVRPPGPRTAIGVDKAEGAAPGPVTPAVPLPPPEVGLTPYLSARLDRSGEGEEEVTAQIALLRAVNVGGHGTIGMADLRRVAETLGLSEVRTFLGTGNLLFRADPRPTRTLEALLEEGVRDQLGVATDILLRTEKEWGAARTVNPFPLEARTEPAHLVIVFLKRAPPGGAERPLPPAVRGGERLRVVGPHAYVVYPDGIARSRLTLPVIEAHLGVRGTGRNWNTVTKLAALAVD